MFVPTRAAQALHEKRESFRQATAETAELLGRYDGALTALRELSAAEIEDRLGGVPWPGARPTEEIDTGGLFLPFAPRWSSAQEARAWAMDRLRDVATVAVDGSQVPASKEFAVPVSLVQVAWFENYHDSNRGYVKDVRNEIVTQEADGEPDSFAYAESRYSQRRFSLEMDVAVERIESLGSEREERIGRGEESAVPVLFVDGTFVLSFAGRMAPEVREIYLEALFHLLDASRRHRVPVVGYVDLSFASDVAGMLRTAFDLPSGQVFDAQLLADAMEPFDRTAALQCARSGVLSFYRKEERDYSADLLFVYLKIGHDRPPARIDLPRWVVEGGLLDHVIDVVRAEIVVGGGYPYALETADAAAVLTTEDRIAFFRLFHEFAKDSGLTASLPAKSVSKAHRR